MKELIDVRFKILWYIKFLEYMGLWEEIDFKYEMNKNRGIYEINNIKYHNWKMYGFCREDVGFDYIDTLSEFIQRENIGEALTEFSKYLEETYDFLPRWKDLNEYLYKLAIIN